MTAEAQPSVVMRSKPRLDDPGEIGGADRWETPEPPIWGTRGNRPHPVGRHSTAVLTCSAAPQNRRARRPNTRHAGPRHPRARKIGRCTPPCSRKLTVYLGRVGGSVPSQTFLTNLSQRAEEVGQEQQLHSTTHPKRKQNSKLSKLVSAILFKAGTHADNPARFRCEEQIQLQTMIAGLGRLEMQADMPAVVAAADAGQYSEAFAAAARAVTG